MRREHGRATVAVAAFLIGVSSIVSAAPTREDFARQRSEGPKLLREGRWAEAASIYARDATYLRMVVDELLYSPVLQRPRVEQPDRRRDILGFHFLHTDLSVPAGDSGQCPHLLPWLREYAELNAKLPPSPAPLVTFEMSHMEMLERYVADLKAHADLSRYGPEALEVLLRGEDSLPVVIVYMAHLQRFDNERSKKQWPDGQLGYFGPVARLNLARMCRNRLVSVPPAIARQLIENGWREAPDDYEKAEMLLALARVQAKNQPSHPEPSKRTRLGSRLLPVKAEMKIGPGLTEPAERVFRTFPATPAAAEARLLAVQLLVEARGPDEALVYLTRLRKDSPTAEGLGEAEFVVSTGYFRRADYVAAERQLLDLHKRCAGTPLESKVLLGLSEIYEKMGRPDEERQYLERCANFPMTQDTARGLMDANNSRSVAQESLAQWYEKREMWKEALQAWSAWKPTSWCGTCAVEQESKRDEHIATCRQHLAPAPH